MKTDSTSNEDSKSEGRTIVKLDDMDQSAPFVIHGAAKDQRRLTMLVGVLVTACVVALIVWLIIPSSPGKKGQDSVYGRYGRFNGQ